MYAGIIKGQKRTRTPGTEVTDGLSHPVAALKQTWVLKKNDYLITEPSAQQ